jgi:hypothetical protein
MFDLSWRISLTSPQLQCIRWVEIAQVKNGQLRPVRATSTKWDSLLLFSEELSSYTDSPHFTTVHIMKFLLYEVLYEVHALCLSCPDVNPFIGNPFWTKTSTCERRRKQTNAISSSRFALRSALLWIVYKILLFHNQFCGLCPVIHAWEE